ncbi:MAG: ABC transporter permease subunit [Clostridia bacterium]|nr:ABC transporter permease subunit [Clostridia bacterium]
MNALIAFIKKEFFEQIRSNKLLILLMIFFAFGIMNPAIARITPWLLEMLADSLAENGMTVTGVTVSAMDSWVQFFKNIPMALIAFVLMESAIFTKEYATGTLVLSLTKGLARYKVLISKTAVLLFTWSAGYFLCYGITYAYNAYFWDNAVAKNLFFSIVCQWLFGIFIIALMVFFSTVSTANTGVLLGTGGTVFSCYLIGLVQKANKYLPTMLMDGNSLIHGTKSAEEYTAAIIITASITLFLFAASIPVFDKKRL